MIPSAIAKTASPKSRPSRKRAVYSTICRKIVTDLHPVGGAGFRAIAEPFVVGYVDLGFGGEGAAVFSGINYPF